MGHHEAVLRAYGLTMTQYTVLLALSREGGMSGAQLARACGVHGHHPLAMMCRRLSSSPGEIPDGCRTAFQPSTYSAWYL